MSLTASTRLGPYEILGLIGAGGMGEVYRARDTRLDRDVAIKVLPAGISADPDRRARFEREAKTVAALAHPHICTLYDVGDQDGSLFLVMEHLAGETLADRLRRGKLPLAEALATGAELADGLAAAHRRSIIHRDLKPANVMLTKSGAKLLDFGLAKLSARGEDGVGAPPSSAASTRSTSLTGGDGMIGTLDYMAPEQIEGRAVTSATDVYALGIVLYEMVAGVPPFAAATPLLSAMRRVSGPPPRRPRDMVHDLPDRWDDAIMRCLDPLPENRFPDAASLAAALTSREEVRRRRHVRPVAAALALVAIVGAAGARVTWLARNPEGRAATESPATLGDVARPAVAVLGFRNSTGRRDSQWLSLALAEMLTTELAASEALRTVPGENVSRMKMELALADEDSFGAETLTRIKRNLGTDFVVFGSYVTVDDGREATLRVDVRLQDAGTRQTVAAFSETGAAAELLDVVSRAGGRLRGQLGGRGPLDSNASIRASEPASPEAVRLYAEGLMRLRRFDAIGARELFEHAIQADPGFLLARSALARAWSALGYDDRARQAAQQAFELSSNLARRDRLQVEGTYREMARSWPEAIAAWRTLTALFPDDVEHALHLANAQIASGAPKDALLTLDGFRKRFPATKDPRLDLASAAAAETLSDFKGMQAMAAAAAAAAESQGARLLVAGAKLREGGALFRQAQAQAAVPLFEDARRLYVAAGDQVGLARALNNMAAALSEGPDAPRALAMYEEGLAIARTIGSQDLTARFLNNIAIQRRRTGDLQTALRLNQESLAIRREIGDRSNAAISLNNIGNVLLDLGDLEGASEHYQQSAAMSREIGDRQGLARTLYNAADSLKLQGQLARARSTNEEALEIRRSINDPAAVASSLLGLGDIAKLQGDLALAKRTLTDALDINRRLKLVRQMGFTLYHLGEVAFVEGDLAAARRYHEDALALRTQQGEKGTAAESRAALAAIALEQGRAADAESMSAEAAHEFEAQHVANYEAVARALLARALLAEGNREAALREAERARALVRNTQHLLARMPVAIAAAQIEAVVNAQRAGRELESLRAEAVGRGLPRYEFEARRALANLELHGSPAGTARLASLRKDAKARGFLLYAR